MYGGGRYYSRSNTFYNRSSYYRGGGERGVARNVQRGMSGTAAELALATRGPEPAGARRNEQPFRGDEPGFQRKYQGSARIR